MAINSITGGAISAIGDKDSFAYKATNTAVDFIPMNKFGKLFKIVKDAFTKYNTSKKPWKGTYSGAPQKMDAGGIYKNREKKLPEFTKDEEKIIYTKYDVNQKIGDKKEAKRIVKSSYGKFYHTNSHYDDFVEITNFTKIGDHQ